MKKQFESKQGSTLVGAIVMGVILAIVAAGAVKLSSISADAQLAALEDTKALYAAESGIQLASRWARKQPIMPSETDGIVKPFATRLSLNGLWVDVEASFTNTGYSSRKATLSSRVWSHPTSVDPSYFRKKVTVNLSTVPFAYYGTFFNSASSGWAGFIDRTFAGRFHMNRYIMISYDATRLNHFTDDVTIANNPGDRWNYGLGDHDGNDYNFGIKMNNTSSFIKDKLDDMFEGKYRANQERIDVPAALSDLNTSLLDGNEVVLPSSTDQGTAESNYRPTLRFNSDGSATYLFYSTKYDSVKYSNIEGKVFYSKLNLNVLGKVYGNATILTKTGKDIVIAGDLVYTDYNASSQSITSMKSSLGLVSGRNVDFITKYKTGISSSSPYANVDLNGDGKLHVNAATLALNTGGQEYWNYSIAYPYDLVYTGCHYLENWYPPSSGSNGAKSIKFLYDKRLNEGVAPVGFPPMKAEGGLWKITLSNWTESNSI